MEIERKKLTLVKKSGRIHGSNVLNMNRPQAAMSEPGYSLIMRKVHLSKDIKGDGVFGEECM